MAVMTDQQTDEALLQFLLQRESYPHNPAGVKHIQTHISHLFIAPPYVYKIKKPVNLDFLDFSTLQQRKYYCEREVELNSRLCDDIYLDVMPIFEQNGAYCFTAGDAEPVEYAVKMKKLDERLFLSEIVRRSTLLKEQLDRVADTLTPFYKNQQPGEDVLHMGAPEKIRVNTDENFDQTEKYVGELIDEIDYEAIKKFTNEHYRRFKELFEERVEEARIVDGHGDLHLEHIHLSPESVCIYDCIEFNDRFRYLDVANDIAFLAMDLDFRGLVRQSHHFTNRMYENLEDPDLLKLIDFYKCYRAYVRAKVKSIESNEPEISKEQRSEAAGLARQYYSLALRYALIGSGPVVLIFMGRVASGKSTLADHIAGKLGLTSFNSDRIRKAQFGLDLYERPPDEIREQIYVPEIHARTYSIMYEKMNEKLNINQSVVIDATFNRRKARDEIREKLGDRGVSFCFIQATASEAVLKERLGRRGTEEKSASDARLEDFEKLEERFQEPDELHHRDLIQVNTGQNLEKSLQELYQSLIERNLDS